jgi:hypothetical protein
MIKSQTTYTIDFTEQQLKELYRVLQREKDIGHLTIDYELYLIYNELKKIQTVDDWSKF